MTMEQNNKGCRVDLNSGKGNGSFKQHNEYMREYCRSHGNVAMVNGRRLGEATLLENMGPLQTPRLMMGMGGSALPNDTTDQWSLVPMWKVARYKLSQN